MAYTTIDKPSDYFETILFTGNGSNGHAISGLDFQPDWVWLKNRNTGNTHEAFDSVRGATKTLYPDRSDEEYVNSTGSLTSFNSDGFTVGSGDGANKSGSGIASWNWKAGTSFTNDASSTGIGSIDSAGSFNNDAGFSIVSWTGTLANGTVKHGLNTAPKMILIKCRGTGSRSWVVYHDSIGNTKHLTLQETDAAATSSASFNNTSPTSSVFSLGSSNNANDNTTMIAYCFAEKQGYSKFGSYTGNGNADGPFIYMGFKPAFVIFKDTATRSWYLMDNKRDPENVVNNRLFPDAGDGDSTGLNVLDFLSNGIKIKTNDVSVNASGNTYTFISFAENPFVTSTGVPATAR